jgi:hypothetical protein
MRPEASGRCRRRPARTALDVGSHALVGASDNRRPVSEVGAFEEKARQAIRCSHRHPVRMVDRPGWRSNSTFVVQDVTGEQDGL